MTLLTILGCIRLVPLQGIQLFLQTIINLFITYRCRFRFLKGILQLNTVYIGLLLLRELFNTYALLVGRRKW